MGLLQKLKSTLGLGSSRSSPRHDQRGEVDVRVEHEPAAETESAVKGTDDGWESTSAEDESGADEESATEETSPEAPEEPTAEEESTAEETSAGADVPVDELSGIGAAYAERLGNAGIESVADLATADAESVAEESGISQGRIDSWIERANDY